MIFQFNKALVLEPSRSVTRGLSSQSGPPPSYEIVAQEHADYVRALRECGLTVEVLPALEEFPDSIFIEDPALVWGNTAILLRPGAPTRIGEAGRLEPQLRQRFQRVLKQERGFADGGDMLLTPEGMMIGLSNRTDREGAGVVSELLGEIGIPAKVVNTPAGTLHLKSDCSLVADDLVLCTRSLADSGIFKDFRKVVVPPTEQRAANALRLNNTILVGENFPLTIELLRKEGHDVRPMKVREIGKIDAGLSCMSLRWSTEARRLQ